MSTNKSHDSLVVKRAAGGFLLRGVPRRVTILTSSEHLLGHLTLVRLGRTLPSLSKPCLHALNTVVGHLEDVFVTDRWALSCSGIVPLIEVGVNSDMKVHAPKSCQQTSGQASSTDSAIVRPNVASLKHRGHAARSRAEHAGRFGGLATTAGHVSVQAVGKCASVQRAHRSLQTDCLRWGPPA